MNREPELKIDVDDRRVGERFPKRPQLTPAAYEALRENFDLEGWNAYNNSEPQTAR